MVDSNIFDENGRLKIIKKMPLKKRAKDWWIQGFQLNRCYLQHWDEIKEIFDKYDVDLNRQGPIITLQVLKQVRIAKMLTERLKNNLCIRKAARNCNVSLKSVYYTNIDEDKIIDGTIFIVLLRLIPEFCLEYGLKNFCLFVENGKFDFLKQAFLTDGTIIETEKDFEKVVKSMVRELTKDMIKEV